ncbi:MAG: hypothetical protein ACYCS7_04415 [Acidimicrobiales bacterium]
MPAHFEFAVLRVPAGNQPGLIHRIKAHRPWLIMHGGPGIGFASDEIPVLAASSDTPSNEPMAGIAGGGDITQHEHLTSTARPQSAAPPEFTSGPVALRWFEVESRHWDEFLDLSASAWPDFEASYEARVWGLFRAGNGPQDTARSLLVTQYASLAEWERSRQAITTDNGAGAEAGERFRRRHQITKWTMVRIGLAL